MYNYFINMTVEYIRQELRLRKKNKYITNKEIDPN